MPRPPPEPKRSQKHYRTQFDLLLEIIEELNEIKQLIQAYILHKTG